MPGLRLARLPTALIAAAASALLLWLALPPADVGPLGFVALVPLMWALRASRVRRGALLGLSFGVLFYGLLLSWLIPVSILGWAALVLGVGAFLALFGAVVPAVWRDRAPLSTAVAVGAAWALVEWLRGVWPFGGWSWVSLGATQHDNLITLPAASVIGAVGLGFLVAAINALVLVALLRAGEWRRSLLPGTAAVALALLPVVLPGPSADGPPVDVAVIQGNVPLEVGTASRIIEDNLVAENHARLHGRLAADPPDLAVWPENALDRDPTTDAVIGPVVEEAIVAVGAPTLVGAITRAEDGRLLNENLLYAEDGRVVDRYAKNHLLPFGEFVPGRRFLDWIPDVRRVRADLSPGTEPGRFRREDLGFASIICFENAFPDLVRDFITEDEGFVVVSTNNATFGVSAAPEQHVVLSELRAVESGRWVVHAALSGISAVIGPDGTVTQRTGLFEPAILRADVPTAEGTTPYDAVGGWLPLAFLALLGAGYLTPRRAPERPVLPLPEDHRVAVILPTYNERETVEEVVERVLTVSDRVDVTVVDDSSPDGTGDLVRKMADREPRVTLLERPEKGGLAGAYLDGFAAALAEGYDVVVEMDADLSHRPEDLPGLLAAARGHHLVLGSRYVPGGRVRNWSLFRRVLSRGGNLYVRMLLGLPLADATSGFRAYRREALRELVARRLRSEGYAFQVELAYRGWRRGLVVAEVPITFEERRHGQSKISRAIVAEALWQVLLWAVRDRVLRRRPPARDRHPSAPPLTKPR
ncbi:MAG TPA: apolipoprotein N-acyltransferase [Actinomycetota bacterium]|nr:apolipoprotein N-acyltransferase [Actinomycetota bacterium]